MEYRRIMFSEGIEGVCMIIITSAPKDEIEKWCNNYNKEQENGKNTCFDSLSEKYYIKILYDSGEDPFECVELIGHDESYDLLNYK